ncbi:MAG: amino acid adenylation domain-containing protein [bacterium]|nr:amino acid adenylation domain-containing protein [bacterium]
MRKQLSDALIIAANQNIKEQSYWLEKLAGDIQRCSFPRDNETHTSTDKQETPRETRQTIPFAFPPGVRDKLEKVSKGSDYTCNLLLTTSVFILLNRYRGSSDMIIGIPIYKNKTDEELINGVLPLRAKIEKEQAVKQLVLLVRQAITEAVDHLNYPVEILPQRLGMDVDDAGAGFPLFDVAVVFDGIHDTEDITSFEPGILFHFSRESGILAGNLEYDSRFYNHYSAETIARHLELVVEMVLADSSRQIEGISLLPEGEKERILKDFNDTSEPYPRDASIIDLFEEQVKKHPQLLAVEGPERSLTYPELYNESAYLSHRLIDKGIRKGDVVAVMQETSCDILVSVLAILMAGGGYMPVDPDYPEERKHFMFEDSATSLLITSRSLMPPAGLGTPMQEDGFFSGTIIYMEDFHSDRTESKPSQATPVSSGPATGGTDLAYVIYTSGSTGRPKGVMVEHRNVTRLVKNTNYIDFRPDDRILQTGALEFDASTFEIWGSLLNGLTLYLIPGDSLINPQLLKETVTGKGITIMWMTVALFNRMVQEDIAIFEPLRVLLVGGDTLSPPHIRQVREAYPGLQIVNGYGPTENTTFSVTHGIGEVGPGAIPIGRPIANSTAYIVDEPGNLQPVGIMGELLVGGDGVARGYLNNPELTAEKFISIEKIIPSQRPSPTSQAPPALQDKSFCGGSGGADFSKRAPLAAGGMLYRTGDLARWRPDGIIDFFGRRDQQVKIRGFRIEPGEIESKLLEHPAVGQVLVMPRSETGDDEKYLCAYIVATEAGQAPPAPVLREFLGGDLPAYMIPSYFIALDKMPLTPNGKVNRRALPEPGDVVSSAPYVAPRNDVEQTLVNIWAEDLDADTANIGINSDFFEIGGHSLKATSVLSQIHKNFDVDIQLRSFFANPTIRLLAQLISKADKHAYIEVTAVEKKEHYEISYAQRRLWILCQFEEESTAYNMPGMFPLQGEFNADAFQQAVQTLVDRHDILRTVFITVDGQQRQRVFDNYTFKLLKSDVRNVEAAGRNDAAEKIYINDANQVFDLEEGPLFHFRAIQLEDEKILISFIIHHIISDGWSQGVISNEVLTLYNYYASGGPSTRGGIDSPRAKGRLPLEPQLPLRGSALEDDGNEGDEGDDFPLPALTLQYTDYTVWHNASINDDTYGSAGNFWVEKFADRPNGIELPLDHPRPPIQTFNGKRLPFPLGKTIMEGIAKIRKNDDATLFMAMLTLLNIFMYKITGREDIIIGSPVAGRRQPELHPLIGFLVNTLVFRNQIEADKSFRRLLKEAAPETLTCYDYQDYPFDLLVEKLELDRDMSQSPIFNVMLAHNNSEVMEKSLQMEGMSLTSFQQSDDFNMSKFDMTFFMDGNADDILVRLEYNTDLFNDDTILRMRDNFLHLCETILENPDAPISQFCAASPGQYEQVTRDFNDTGIPYRDMTIPEMFRDHARQHPERSAVVYQKADGSTERLTYGELDQKSDRLAAYLYKVRDIGLGDIVGICIDRSLDMVVSILAIIKSGAGYLAIDPNYPEDRVLHMLTDSECKLVIRDETETKVFDDYKGALMQLPGARAEIMRESEGVDAPVIKNKASDIIYVIYTSGTTGTPNGAMLNHGILTNLILWQQEATEIDNSLRCLQFTSTSFCVSFQEIAGTLTSGGELHLIGDVERQDIDYLMNFLSTHKIEVLYLPFSYLNFLFNESDRWGEDFKHYLKHIITAGEQLKITSGLREFLLRNPFLKLHNHYGSSEMHVVASYTLDAATMDAFPVPPAGKPIGNTAIYILDDFANPVPIGVWGELYVSGACEIAGYIRNPELTREKLVAHPEITGHGKKLYRSGDLGRRLPDGNIELKGRKDSQIKIRGFRVELSEIESRILSIDGIKECVVVVKENDKKQKDLYAYISREGIEVAEIKKTLGLYMPQYMIPRFISMEALPLMPNGKVDREKLPEPEPQEQDNALYVPPTSSVDNKLADIWADLLNVENSRIGIDDNFFDIGGHSLKATTMISRIHREFNVKAKLVEVFRSPTIRELGRHICGLQEESHIAIPTVEEREYYPLSPAQERLYIIDHLFHDDKEKSASTGYNLATALVMEGDVDKKALEDTFSKIIRRQESLRTSFHMVNKTPVQKIHREVDFQLEYYDPTQPGGALDPQAGFVRPFDLSQAPLVRVGLIKLPDREGTGTQEYMFMLDMHHIISDGVSLGLMVAEVTTLFQGGQLPELTIRYRDYALWQESLKHSGDLARQEEYCLSRFAGEIPVLTLPLDFPRPRVQDFAGAMPSFVLPPAETAALKKLSIDTNTTLFMMLSAIFSILLSKLSGQEDIIVGSPTAGRRHADLEPLIGMFVNTVALRYRPEGNTPFITYLEEVRNDTLEAFDNQDYQFEALVERLGPAVVRNTGRNPLFDVMFSFRNMDTPEVEVQGIKIRPHGFKRKTALFDLTLSAMEAEDRLIFPFEYCSALFKAETIKRFFDYYQRIVCEVTRSPQLKLSEIDILSADEKRRLLVEMNETACDYPAGKTLHRLFEEQVSRTPDHIALSAPITEITELSEEVGTSDVVSMTYKELDRLATGVAKKLMEKGVGPDSIVGLLAERSPEAMVGIFAILKAGGAYLPIALDIPPDRMSYMLEDSRATKLLTSITPPKGLDFIETLSLPDFRPGGIHSLSQSPLNVLSETDSGNLAYVIYTSGSTGRPKGVLVEHRSAANLVFAIQRKLAITPGDRMFQLYGISFDASVLQIFSVFLSGAHLRLISRETMLDEARFNDLAARFAVTHLISVPAFLLGMNIKKIPSIRGLVTGGEDLPATLVNRWTIKDEGGKERQKIKEKEEEKSPSDGPSQYDVACDFFNLYGPTEATVASLGKKISSRVDPSAKVPIGLPFENTAVYICDKWTKPVPYGVAGELLIGGHGVARGYLNRPELTAERFIPNPFENSGTESSRQVPAGSRLYRTGDLVRWLPDDDMMFMGRIDQQVKIRGFRIEPGEIENRLNAHQDLAEAVVIPRSTGDDAELYLCAYYVPKSSADPADDSFVHQLKEYLGKDLPAYMVPSHFVQLETIPLTPNGKVDKRKLPDPVFDDAKNYAAPRTPIEEKLVALWADILNLEPQVISIDGNFFDLGGQSLKAAVMAAGVHKATDVKVPLDEIFRAPTIRALTDYISGAAGKGFVEIEPADEGLDYYPASAPQKRMYALQQMNRKKINYNMFQVIPLDEAIDIKRVEAVFNQLIQRHESLRTSFFIADDVLVQKIHKNVEFRLESIHAGAGDLSAVSAQFLRPFDLSKAPLLRAAEFGEGDTRVLLVDVHHIVNDGTSQNILKQEFAALYTGAQLPPLRLQYKDYACWHNSEQQKKEAKKQEHYWLDRFAAEQPKMELPMDFPRPKTRSFVGSRISFMLPEAETQALKVLSRQQGTTFFMTMLSAVVILLHRLSGLDDITIGTPVAGRGHADLQNIIGMFVNLLSLRTRMQAGESTLSLLEQVKANTLAAFANQNYQFEDLVEETGARRDTSGNPLFDVMFNYREPADHEGVSEIIEEKPVTGELIRIKELAIRYDIAIRCIEMSQTAFISFDYSTALFNADTAERMVGNLRRILFHMGASPEMPIGDIDIISPL